MNKEEMEREKIYINPKKRNTFVVLLIAIIAVYLFFFTSKILIPEPITDKSMVTKIGDTTDFAQNRTYTLLSAEYSPDQMVMEIMITFQNLNYDNVNDYYYAITSTGADPSDIIINNLYNEDLFTVIRLENLKKNYGEIDLLFAPKVGKIEDVTDDMTGTIILNKYNVDEKNMIDLEKTKEDYLQDRLEKIIDELYKKLNRQEEKLELLINRKTALEDEISNSEKDADYMTAGELYEQEKAINENKEELEETKKEIETQKKRIANTQNDIKDAESKSADMR